VLSEARELPPAELEKLQVETATQVPSIQQRSLQWCAGGMCCAVVTGVSCALGHTGGSSMLEQSF
jgi:hypothetical protein